MSQPSMRITVDAAMRTRDVSRPYPASTEGAKGAESTQGEKGGKGGEPSTAPARSQPARPAQQAARPKPPKGERRRLGKRAARRASPPDGG